MQTSWEAASEEEAEEQSKEDTSEDIRFGSSTTEVGMDRNKAAQLAAMNYEIKPCCGLCKHAQLAANGWGTCGVHSYQHEKHKERRRQTSIHRFGVCPTFVPKESALAEFQHYGQFLDLKLIPLRVALS